MRWLVWAVLGIFVCLLLPVLADFRVAMGDEAAYADPALRWADGLGFTSGAWWQSPDQLWACNFPLYALVCSAWIKLTGLSSLWGLRVLSLLLYLGGVVLWILGCRRAGWFKSWREETAFVLLLLGSLYATAPSQYIRPEALGAAVLGTGLFGQTLSSPRLRMIAAFVTGLLTALSGLQFVVALAVFASVWLVIAGKQARKPVATCVAGGFVAVVVLVAVYWHFGVLDVFLRSTFGLGSNRAEQWHGWRDPMLWAASAVLVSVFFNRGMAHRERLVAVAGLVCGPSLATTLFMLSKYPQYYGFLAALALCTATAVVVPAFSGRARIAVFGLLFGAGMIGFPLAALMNWNVMPARDHAALEIWMREEMRGAKKVFVDPSAYFAARSPGRLVHTQAVLPSLSKAERRAIEAVVLLPGHSMVGLQKQTVLPQIGGEWRLAASYPEGMPESPRCAVLNPLSRLSYAGMYHFEVFERIPETTAD
jgi:hypothetical protein